MSTADRAAFLREQYVELRSLASGPLLAFLWRYVVERAADGRLGTRDADLPGTLSAYGDLVMEHLLDRFTPRVEETTGLSLYPTYSYLRLYGTGDALAPHVDREACEVSLSLNIGQEPSVPWPLWIRGASGARAVRLEPGDAVVYRGIECEHWRERYDGVRLAQVFLHYVDQAGPHASWRFDRRAALDLSVPLPI